MDSKPMQPKECKIKIEYDIEHSRGNVSSNDLEKQTDHKSNNNMQIDVKDLNSTELPHISGLCLRYLSRFTDNSAVERNLALY